MKKITVSVTPRQSGYLEREIDRLGVPLAELIRRAMDHYIETHPEPPKALEKRDRGT